MLTFESILRSLTTATGKPTMLPSQLAARAAASSASASASASTPHKQRDLAPVLTFGKAAASCSSQARVYGACILAQYETVEKSMCEREFQQFKQCVSTKVREEEEKGHRWTGSCTMRLPWGGASLRSHSSPALSCLCPLPPFTAWT